MRQINLWSSYMDFCEFYRDFEQYRGLIFITSGSKRNWGSLCKALHRDMPHRPIYAVDLRNHGTSPHATPMTYEAMALDVHRFIEDKKLRSVALLGHSMWVT